MKALIIIGCVVLYIAAGYITAWFFEDDDPIVTPICVTFWPVILFSSTLYFFTSYLPRKIFNKFRKQ